MKMKNNRLWHILNGMGQLIIASILWGFCCLPIFTIGASCTALYYTVVKVVRREAAASIMSEFFHSFRRNFSQSLVINMIFLGLTACVSLLALPHIQTLTIDRNPDSVLYLCFGLLLLYGWMPLFVYPCLSRFEFSVKQIFMWTLYAGIKNALKALGLFALLLITIIFSVYQPVFLILTPGVFSLISSFVIEPILRSSSDRGNMENYSKWYDDSEKTEGNEEDVRE